MSSPQAAPKVATAEHSSILGDKHVANAHVPAARVLHPKHREALKLRLDLNLEVEIHIQAKVNGDITLSLLPGIGTEPGPSVASLGLIKTRKFH
ncbi:hypothetical protein EV421DRAFT_1903326 [Armillaria borealis]|uniref:Uncharacterized protein n=1 Tax=Armillaria borealis TaxID=47425 RepID=A0AA39JLW5_9AGAR|nr:hypothetical protein EV421DRAFT_1903326 [Armillaria borealis]